MAETIVDATGVAMAGLVKTRETNAGQNANAAYGYQQYVEVGEMNAGLKAHVILGAGVPSVDATYDLAPLSSLYFNTSGGDGVCLYVKEAAGGAGWAPVTTGAAA